MRKVIEEEACNAHVHGAHNSCTQLSWELTCVPNVTRPCSHAHVRLLPGIPALRYPQVQLVREGRALRLTGWMHTLALKLQLLPWAECP